MDEDAAGRGPGPTARALGRAEPAPQPRALGRLCELGHEPVERLPTWPKVLLAQGEEGTLREPLAGGEVLHALVHVEQAGEETTVAAALLDEPQGGQAIGGVVVLPDLLKHQVG